MKVTLLGLISVLLIFSLQIATSAAYAETEIIKAEEIATVSGLYPDSTARDQSIEVGQNPLQERVKFGVGIKYVTENEKTQAGEIISYIRFDITKIPKSDWLNSVSIDSAELKLTAFKKVGGDRLPILLSYCSDNSWSEETIKWTHKPCTNIFEGGTKQNQEIVSISTDEFPKIYVWEVTNGVIEARAKDYSDITFLVEPHTTSTITQGSSNYVLFAPSENILTSFLRSENIEPELDTKYTVSQTVLGSSLVYIITGVVASIIVTLIFWKRQASS